MQRPLWAAARLAALLAARASWMASADAGAAGVWAKEHSPVERVVTLLQEMRTRLEGDQKKEQQVYDKYACWCETTTSRKAGAVEGGKSDLRGLGQSILIEKGDVASMIAEIAQLGGEARENEEAQREATAIRQKENAAYQAETGELKQAIAALEKAVVVLRDASAGGAFLQASFAQRASKAIEGVQDALFMVPTASMARLTEPRRSAGGASSRLALLRNYAAQFSRGGGQAHSRYAPQSATIVGILDEMYATFTDDLQGMDSTEAGKNKAFEELMEVKQKELELIQVGIEKAEKEKAESELMLAEASQAYDDTSAQLQSDIEFFDHTKGACEAKSDAWKDRKALREQELTGIAKALEILTSDDARELFGRAIKPGVSASFLQVVAEDGGAAVPAKKAAYQALKTGATKTHSLRLARMAATVHAAKVGHFDGVLKAIETMIEELGKEDKSDTDKRDQCLGEYQKINSTVADLAWKVEVNVATIAKLTKTIEELEVSMAKTIEEIEGTEKTMVEMKKEREAENAAFLEAKKDDEDAIELLKKAKDTIAEFYKNGGETAFAQRQPEFERSADDAPDADFSDKHHRKGEAHGIVAILAHLVEDLTGEIATAKKAEAAAQVAYEDSYKSAEDLLGKLKDKKTNLEGALAQRNEEKTEEGVKKTQTSLDIESKEKYRSEIQPDCDFMILKFDTRRRSRQAERDGLTKAKEFLAGFQDKSVSAVAQDGGRSLAQVATSGPFDRLSFRSLSPLRGTARPISPHAPAGK